MMVSGVGTKHYFHHNHLYSVAAMTSSTGAVVERYRYDAYGKRTVTNAAGTPIAASTIGQQRGFTGHYLDAETGLYYARARMYSAGLGRFVNRDPLRYIDGYLLYGAYFIPNALDPSGKAYVTTVPIPDGYEDAGTTDGSDSDPITEGDESTAEYRDMSEVTRTSNWEVTSTTSAGISVGVSGAYGSATLQSTLQLTVGHTDSVTSTDTLQQKMYQVVGFRKKFQLAVKCCVCALDCLRGPPSGWVNDPGAGTCSTMWKKGIKNQTDYMKGTEIGRSWRPVSSDDRFKLKNSGISGTAAFVQNEFLSIHKAAVRAALGIN